MLLSQIEFFLLFPLIVSFFIAIKNNEIRKKLLIIFSYYFYAYWDWRFLAIVFFVTFFNYFGAQWIEKTINAKCRKYLLCMVVVGNLLPLLFSKYCNFFIESFSALFSNLNFQLDTIYFVLPIGISYFTFRVISYVVDVYRKDIYACRNIFDFALFVSFFPVIIAGPIVRARDILPQFVVERRISWERTYFGVIQFTFGLVKKSVIADRVAIFVNTSFANAAVFDSSTTWLFVISYGVQIYCDFSGYSDMAIGVARVLGYDLKENFDYPYASLDIAEFWRRWHISLSSWFRDYLYIPLGGSRKGRVRTYLNVVATMLLCGLWHGASWRFLAWGGGHGLAIIVQKIFSPYLRIEPKCGWLGLYIKNFLGWLLTFLVVNVLWVFFRADTFSGAILIIGKMFTPSGGVQWYPPFAIGALLFVLIVHVVKITDYKKLLYSYLPFDRILAPIVMFSLLWFVYIFRSREYAPFIYFQF